MSFPAYPECKESGAPWLEQVPAHWELSRIGARFAERRQKVSDADYPPLSVTKNGVVPQLETAAKTDDNDNRKCVLAGDFVINSRSDRKGSSGLSSLDGSVSLINTVIEPDATMHGLFVHHLFRSAAFQEEYYRYGKGIVADLWSTNYGEMKAITLAVPPMEEQRAIAAFLDRETAKIDALVAEQERLIALLKEKRQAVISHAVTKGLDPNAPMKDSGIDWLGEIPAHWELSRLKFVTKFVTSGSRGWGDYYADEGPLFIRIGNLTRDSIQLDMTDEQRVSIPENTEGSRARLLPGDLLFSITAYLGSVAVVPPTIEEAYISQHVALCRLTADSPISEWLGHVALSIIGRTHFDLRAYGGTKVQLSLADVAEMPILIPPVEEQESILAELASQVATFRELEEQAEAAISLLQERRAALISAAVTGKIDVRLKVEQHETEAA